MRTVKGEPVWWFDYTRISDDRAGRAIGVDRQREEIEKLREREGGELATRPDGSPARYVDNDLTAFDAGRKGAVERPRFDEMLTDIDRWDRGGQLVIGVLHPDRLQRPTLQQTGDLMDFLRARNVLVAAAWSGWYDLSTPAGRKRLRDDSSNARFESEHKQQRVLDAMERIAEEGRPVGGMRPFGYRRIYDAEGAARRRIVRDEIDPDEAAVVRQIAAWLLDEGRSTAWVLRRLDEDGVRTARGNRFSHAGLKTMFMSGRFAGLRDHRTADGQLRQYPAAWPAILERDRWAQVRAVLADPARGAAGDGKYLLSGKLLCGHPAADGDGVCGRTLIAGSVMDGRRRFNCRPAGGNPYGERVHLSVLYAGVEEYVVALVLDRIERDGLGGARADVERSAELRDANAVDETKLAGLIDAFVGQADADAPEFRAATGRLREQIRVRNGELAAILGRAVEVDPATIRADWPGLSFDAQRRIIDATVESVTVAPARRSGRFDPARLSPSWR